MGFPIYTNTNNTSSRYLHTGILYNSVLVLCIVFSISFILVIYYVIEVIKCIYVYIKK
jgi:hypothetical protein